MTSMTRPHTVLLCLAALGSLPVSGDIVTLEFAGTVASVNNRLGAVSPSLIRVGDPVQVSVRYDTTTPDHRPEANWGGYVSPGWLRVSVRDMAFERNSAVTVDVLHGANGDQHLFQVVTDGPTSAWPAALSGPEFPGRQLSLGVWETRPPIDLLTGPELPTSLDVTRADFAIVDVGVSNADGLNAYSFQVQLSQVPEPGAGRLLILGSILCAGLRWRQVPLGSRLNC